MSSESIIDILEDIERENAIDRNADIGIEEELRSYSEDLSVVEAEDYWREVYSDADPGNDSFYTSL